MTRLESEPSAANPRVEPAFTKAGFYGPSDEPRGMTFQQDIYPKVMELLPKDKNARILDVGAGEGYLCKLARDAGYTNVEACDFRPDFFLVDGVPFHQADLNGDLPLPDASVDCVVTIEVIEHIENHFKFMSELMRVVKPGGTVIVTTPNVLSIPSRWHFFWFGYTDCARRPLDPRREDHYMQHINPISVPELMFHFEHNGGEMIELTTNRFRRSAWLPMIPLYPIMAVTLRRKLMKKRYADMHEIYRRHLKWVLTPANLMGRITIAVGQRNR